MSWRPTEADDSGASIPAMSDWARRRGEWEQQRLWPSIERAPERMARFTTISDVEVDRLYGPWNWDSEPGSAEPAGPGGPTAVDHHGDPLAHGRWDDFDPA